MLLSQAHSLLKEHGTSDNAKHFKMLFTQEDGAHTNESTLTEYVEYVTAHTDAWLQNFPESLRSLTAVSKPKTAFLKMLTIPLVMTHLGAQRCFDVADKVSDSYRKLAKRISDNRQAASAATSVSATAPTVTAIQAVQAVTAPRDQGSEPQGDDESDGSGSGSGSSVESAAPVTWTEDDEVLSTARVSVEDTAGDMAQARTHASARAHAALRHPGGGASRDKQVQKPLRDRFVSLVRVLRDVSIMLDDVLSERVQ